MWATVRLSTNGDQLQRIIQNLEVRKIQTVYRTVQVQIRHFRHEDKC